jgi:hypothetical protein
MMNEGNNPGTMVHGHCYDSGRSTAQLREPLTRQPTENPLRWYEVVPFAESRGLVLEHKTNLLTMLHRVSVT